MPFNRDHHRDSSNTQSARAAFGKNRLISLDALRGFNMFWIIGARSLAEGLDGLDIPGASVLAGQLYHSAWNGFTFYDLMFPLFIFITGISLVLSLRKRRGRGDSRRSVLKHVLQRTAVLFLLGIAYNGIAGQGPLLDSIRLMGVLQRIAICYLIASLLVLYTGPGAQAAAAIGILVGYWAMMRFIPVPGYGAGVWTEQGNLAHYVDQLLMPGRLFYGSWDPEGLLSTIPAVATCLLGVLTGHWLNAGSWPAQRLLSNRQRALYLFLAGTALAVAGILLNPFFPINKKIWTSSFVLLTGGLFSHAPSHLLLADRCAGSPELGLSLCSGRHELDLHLSGGEIHTL